MKQALRYLTLAGCALFLSVGCAKTNVAELLDAYLWEKRVLLVFTPSADYPVYKEQMRRIQQHQNDLKERDMVVWQLVRHQSVVVDGEQKAQLGTPAFYEYFNVRPHNFTIILLGKDGEEKLRESQLVRVRDMNQLIDRMPMRQKEMRKKTSSTTPKP